MRSTRLPSLPGARRARILRRGCRCPDPASAESLSDLYTGGRLLPLRATRLRLAAALGRHAPAYGSVDDAGLFGARLGLEEAYRFARGERSWRRAGSP